MAARWALIGKEGDGFSEFARDMLRASPYQVLTKNGYIYFKTNYDIKTSTKLIRFSNKISSKNFKNKANFRLLNYKSPLYRDVTPFSLADDALTDISKQLEEEAGFHRFKSLSRYIFYASNTQLFDVLCNDLAPSFFTWYPNGSIYICSLDVAINAQLAALRILGAIDRIGKRKMQDKERYRKYLGLSDAQPSHIARPSKYLSIPIALSLPKPIGFLTPRLVDTFIFLFDEKVEDVRGVFPRSGLEYFRSEASLLLHEHKEDFFPLDVLEKNELLDSFSFIRKDFPQKDWWSFILQYASRLNDFLFYVTNPANFTGSDGHWSNLTQYFVWLSFERLCDEVILLLTEDNHYLRKQCFFRVLDQLASLREKNSREQTKVFKDFILPETHQVDAIKEGLDEYHGNLGKHLKSELQRVRNNLKSKVLDSVILDEFKNSTTEKVTLPDGEEVSFNEYVRELVRQLRNSSHGYSTNKYLTTNSGNLPDDISLLGILAFLAFIAKPENFLRLTWDD